MPRFLGMNISIALILVLGSCNKSSVSPTQQEPVATPLLYFVGTDDHASPAPKGHIFRYHVGQKILDSFAVPDIITVKGAEIEVMPDGSKLYYSDIPDGTAKLIDLVTGQVVDTLYYPVDEMVLSPNGKWLALLNNGTIFILDTETHEVLFERRMVTAYSGSFLPDDSWFYCIMTGQGSTSPLVKVIRIRTSDWLVDSILVPVIRYPSQLVVIDTQHFAFYGAISVSSGESNEIAIFDNSLNSVTYRHQFSPGYGDLLYNPHLQELYFTAPGGWQDILPTGSYWLYVVSDPLSIGKLDSFSVSVAVPRTPIIPGNLNLWPATQCLSVTQSQGVNIVLYSLLDRKIDTLLTSGSTLSSVKFISSE